MLNFRTRVLLIAACFCLSHPRPPTSAQQIADPAFRATVEHPAYTRNFPRVFFDEAHNNFDTVAGRYKPFADLIGSDGYHIVAGRKSFTKESLDTFKVLVTANALGAEDVDDEGAERSAYTDEECDAVRDWVRNGGALLLMADHKPFSRAAANLAKRFGVDMTGDFTADAANAENARKDFIVYSQQNHLLLGHPITEGRDDNEKIKRVIVFTGQSLKGPDGSIAFLKLADSAVDIAEHPPWLDEPLKQTSAAGRAQALAFKFGKGRVVVMGDADMLSALLAGPGGRETIGMNYPGIDNRQLALNIMHWLSGLLKER